MKYHLVKNILPWDTCILAGRAMTQDENYSLKDPQVPNSKCFYSPPYLEVLLPIIQPKIEQVWNKTLIPTYVFSRILHPGTDLMPHKDRPSCEYSVTVTIGHNYPEEFEYPIYMEGEPINVPVSYGATYKGCEVEHWREPLIGGPNNFWIQAFFHYVDANGPFAEFAWDKNYS